MRFPGLVFILPLLAMLVACDQGIPVSVVEEKARALMDARINQSPEQVLGYYSESFFENRPREEWGDYLQKLEGRLGHVQKYVLRKRQSDTRFSGRFYIFEYLVTYEKGKAWETLTWIHPVDKEELNLIGHHIRTEGM